jgi:hypothetical protein
VVPSTAKPPTRGSGAHERPTLASSPEPESYAAVDESEVSFASVAPAAPEAQVSAVAPLPRHANRPSGHPTPPRSEAVRPVSIPATPLSESDIRISIDEEEPQ